MALCSCNSRQEPLLTATLEGIQADSVYLYKVDNEYYDAVSPYASIEVVDGKFTFALDTVPASVYCLSLQDMRKGGALEQSKYLFLEPVKIQLTVSKDKEGHLALHVTGSYLQEKYEAFQKDKYIAGEQAVTDSLDRLFYAARDRSDTVEIERIREISIPYYEKGRELVSELIRNEVEKNKKTSSGCISIILISSKIIHSVPRRRLKWMIIMQKLGRVSIMSVLPRILPILSVVLR